MCQYAENISEKKWRMAIPNSDTSSSSCCSCCCYCCNLRRRRVALSTELDHTGMTIVKILNEQIIVYSYHVYYTLGHQPLLHSRPHATPAWVWGTNHIWWRDSWRSRWPLTKPGTTKYYLVQIWSIVSIPICASDINQSQNRSLYICFLSIKLHCPDPSSNLEIFPIFHQISAS